MSVAMIMAVPAAERSGVTLVRFDLLAPGVEYEVHRALVQRGAAVHDHRLAGHEVAVR